MNFKATLLSLIVISAVWAGVHVATVQVQTRVQERAPQPPLPEAPAAPVSVVTPLCTEWTEEERCFRTPWREGTQRPVPLYDDLCDYRMTTTRCTKVVWDQQQVEERPVRP